MLNLLFGIGLSMVLVPGLASSTNPAAAEAMKAPHLQPVYHVPLRIHLGQSGRPLAEWPPVLAEINHIWLSQDAICFEIHTVDHDEELGHGLDLWFTSFIPQWNGYYRDPNDMHVRDEPDLRPALRPAESAAARTAAHEIGHALGLGHRQDSDDNLMRSKTYGWQLHPAEIKKARQAAPHFALEKTSGSCGPPAMHNRL